MFDGAWRNFRAAAAASGAGRNFQGVLIFTESAGDMVFSALAETAAQRVGRWAISRTKELNSLNLRRHGDASLLLLAGRQLISAERLELSAYFVAEPLPDGAPLATLLKLVDVAGGLSVLPWGVGKWLGRRGRYVKEKLMHSEVPLMVSDNGGRPWLWPLPRLLRIADEQGIPVLAGTDPLPMMSEQLQVGRYGFILNGALSLDTPAQDLKGRLLSLARSPVRYGERERTWRFFRNQLHMQLRRAR